MSYWVHLEYKPKKIAIVPSHKGGGTFVAGGTNKAILNVTYNYNVFFVEHLGDKGLYWLYGKQARETMGQLERASQALANFPTDEDYWRPTAGNTGRVIDTLLEWARLHPRAFWKVI